MGVNMNLIVKFLQIALISLAILFSGTAAASGGDHHRYKSAGKSYGHGDRGDRDSRHRGGSRHYGGGSHHDNDDDDDDHHSGGGCGGGGGDDDEGDDDDAGGGGGGGGGGGDADQLACEAINGTWDPLTSTCLLLP